VKIKRAKKTILEWLWHPVVNNLLRLEKSVTYFLDIMKDAKISFLFFELQGVATGDNWTPLTLNHRVS
jgi:hypothetical protein